MLTRTQLQDTKAGDVKQKVSCSISKNKQEIYENYKENTIITTECINTQSGKSQKIKTGLFIHAALIRE